PALAGRARAERSTINDQPSTIRKPVNLGTCEPVNVKILKRLDDDHDHDYDDEHDYEHEELSTPIPNLLTVHCSPFTVHDSALERRGRGVIK
ncbi:MAG: hypothetical protein KBB56_13700, partial [Acidobacteria bacterium]|nr:hypothetical protein [Acidobacteriota bacterium]